MSLVQADTDLSVVLRMKQCYKPLCVCVGGGCGGGSRGMLAREREPRFSCTDPSYLLNLWLYPFFLHT